MKKVFLDELPHNGKNINWKESIGYKINFIYNDIEDNLEIINYYYDNKIGYLTIKCNNKCMDIRTGDFIKCKIGKLLNKKTRDFKIEIGTTFKDNKRDITIIDREYRVNKRGQYCKYYKYHCNVDGNEDWLEESHLLTRNQGCNVCCGRKALLGVNTIWDKTRWMCDLGVSEEDAKTHTPQSGDEIEVVCPYCKKNKKCIVRDVYDNHSIGCSCGDGISYPNKFIIKLCEQLLKEGKINDFKTEYKIKDKKYDIFIVLNNSKTLIIENHGEQHGKFIYNGNILFIKNVSGFGERNEILNDIYKCKLAYDSEVDNYIQLDCTVSDPEYIKHSIENSILSIMFDLSDIDWNKCDEYALKNIVKEVCEYWKQHREVNKEDITSTTLAKVFNLDSHTIVTYLNKGTKLCWCNYNGKEEQRKASSKNIQLAINKQSNVTLIYDLNMNYITECKSALWIQNNSLEKFGVYLNSRRISDVATGKKPSYKGFIFRYKKDVENI